MKKQKVLKVLGAAALVGLTTLTMTSCSLTDWIGGIIHPTEKPETPTPDEDNKQDSGNVIVDGKELGKDETVDHMPQAIAFRRASNDVSAQSAQGATVTFNATVEPDYAVDKNVTWSLAWNGSNSGNVNDYVSLNITNETHTVTVTCKKVFNTQINLTAKTSGGQTATATLDVLKEVSKLYASASYYNSDDSMPDHIRDSFDLSQNFNISDSDGHFSDISFCNLASYADDNANGDCKYIYMGFLYSPDDIIGTVGSIKGIIEYSISDEFKAYLNSNVEYKNILTYYKSYTDCTGIVQKNPLDYNNQSTMDDNFFDEYNECQVPCFWDLTYECSKSTKDSNKIKLVYLLNQAFKKFSQEDKYALQAKIKVINNYNGQDYVLANGTFHFNLNLQYSFETTGISISSSSGVFTQA